MERLLVGIQKRIKVGCELRVVENGSVSTGPFFVPLTALIDATSEYTRRFTPPDVDHESQLRAH